MSELKKLNIALAGNPNSGKTTIFNAITGARQHVGNWPGVTVEKVEGHKEFEGYDLNMVDLPGTYSITAYSIEEIVTRKYIVHDKPDVVVHVIDAGNLERNLFLTTQLLELDCKLVLALNMSDVLDDRKAKIDLEMLGTLLGAPAVLTIGTSSLGINNLLRTVIQVAEGKHPITRNIDVRYGHEIENHLSRLSQMIRKSCVDVMPGPPRYIAIKLLENDDEVRACTEKIGDDTKKLLDEVEKTRDHLFALYKDDPETIFTERRYGFVAGILKEVYFEPPLDRISRSDQIDSVLTHKMLGLPVFFVMIWAMFQLTFTVGAYPMDWIGAGVGLMADFLSANMVDGLSKDLLVNGIINGVGAVLVFIPNIFILFLFISFMEDSGYMARAAFLTDRVMHLLGLHGKAFIPMIMGFGCNAPAIMATRTLESERDRILAIMINPLMSCSARLPVYILIAGAFFPKNAGSMVFSIYLIGLVLAIAMGKLFSKTILPGEAAPFVMELPPYRMPTARSLLIHMWDRGKIFLRKMGGVILFGAVIIWALGAFPRNMEFSQDYDAQISSLQNQITQTENAESQENSLNKKIKTLSIARETERIENSYIGRMGKAIVPVFAPLGFDWRNAVSLVTGFVAKEIVVSTLGVLYQVGEEEDEKSEGLQRAIQKSGMTPLVGFAFMVFVLIYTPCLGTLAAIKRETNSWKWTAFSVGYSLTLAWIVAFVIVQAGRLIGLG